MQLSLSGGGTRSRDGRRRRRRGGIIVGVRDSEAAQCLRQAQIAIHDVGRNVGSQGFFGRSECVSGGR